MDALTEWMQLFAVAGAFGVPLVIACWFSRRFGE